MYSFTYYTDPGHGWVEVPLSLIHELGLTNKITPCSYQRGDTVYLEEDCDAGELIAELKHRGLKYDIKVVNSDYDSFIRSLRPYAPLVTR
jgi:hypothetical protein